MQSIISGVTPFDLSMQVRYSCVISLSAAASAGVLNASAKTISRPSFVRHVAARAPSLPPVVIFDHLRAGLAPRDAQSFQGAPSPRLAVFAGAAWLSNATASRGPRSTVPCTNPTAGTDAAKYNRLACRSVHAKEAEE